MIGYLSARMLRCVRNKMQISALPKNAPPERFYLAELGAVASNPLSSVIKEKIRKALCLSDFLAEDKGFEFTRISNILFQLLSLSAILSRSMYYRHSFVRNNFVH